ncbi:MAG: hypothetical protein K6348_10155 [Deferribacterales bacterium]
MFVKVCGITREEDIDTAIELGYSAIGVVLYPKSPRYIGLEKSIKLANYAKGKIKTVAVAINFSEVTAVEKYFDHIQISEFIEMEKLILAIEDEPAYHAKIFILDRSKGKGKFVNIPDWVDKIKDKLILAGGLTPENVFELVKRYKPFGVDVSSGVESTYGIKDRLLMKKFMNEIKRGMI